MTEPKPVYSAKDNGKCECGELEQWAAKLQRAARYQLRRLREDGNDPMTAQWLLAQIHAFQLVLDGPQEQRVVAPLVRPTPAEACAWPPQPCDK